MVGLIWIIWIKLIKCLSSFISRKIEKQSSNNDIMNREWNRLQTKLYTEEKEEGMKKLKFHSNVREKIISLLCWDSGYNKIVLNIIVWEMLLLDIKLGSKNKSQ